MSKNTGLAAFTAPKKHTLTAVTEQAAVSDTSSTTGRRKRGSASTVALTVRVQRSDWERLHALAISEGESLQSLAVMGLSMVFQQKGLPGLEEH